MSSIIPLSLLFKVMGDQAAISRVDQLGKSGRAAGEAIKAGTAQAWSPMIGQLKKAEEEQRNLTIAAKKYADDQIAAAKAAAQAVKQGADDQKAALKAVADQEKENARIAVQAAKDQAQVYKTSQTISNGAIQTAGRTQVNAIPSVPTGTGADVAEITRAQQLGAAQQVGGMVSSFFDSRKAAQDAGVQIAETKEAELKSIEALQGSAEAAQTTYDEIDQLSLKSVFDLEKLTDAGKTLATARIYNKRNLTAADDLAAVGMSRGVTPQETAFALQQLQNGAFGHGFAELRRIGLSNQDFQEQGLKFSSANEFEGTSQQAIEGVVKAIEKKFGGLSERLATETTTGAVDQLSDAQHRYAGQMQGELLPAIRVGATALTDVTTVFANLPGPLKAIWAYGGASVIGLGQLAGSLISGAATAGQAMIAYRMLTGGTFAAGAAADVAAAETDALSVSLATRLSPALAGLGSFVSVALPLAVAAGIALMIKSVADGKDDALDKSYAGPEPGKGLGPTNTRLGAIASADDKERQADEIDKTIEEQKTEKAKSWPINLFTGLTPAQYQDHIENLEMERDSLRKDAQKLRSKAPSLSDTAPAVAAPSGVPAGMVAPTAQDSFQVGPGVNPTGAYVGSSDAFTGQIRSLEDQKTSLQGNVNKDKRDAITLQIRSLRRQQQDSKAGERDARKAERQKEKEVAKLGKRQDKVSGYDADVQTAKDEIADQDKIDDLQYRLEKAKDDANAEQVRALTLELEQEKARQRYAKARGEAAKAGITDAEKANSMNKIADLKLADELRKATVTANRAKQNVVDSGGKGKAAKTMSLSQIGALMAAMNGGVGSGVAANALRPSGMGDDPRFANLDHGSGYANMAWDKARGYAVDPADVAASLYNGGQVGGGVRLGLGIPSAGDFTGADRRKAGETARIARIKSQRTTNQGKIRIEVEPIIIDEQDAFGGWNGDA